MRLPNTFGRAEKVTAEYTYGTRATAGYSLTFHKPLLGNPNIRYVKAFLNLYQNGHDLLNMSEKILSSKLVAMDTTFPLGKITVA